MNLSRAAKIYIALMTAAGIAATAAAMAEWRSERMLQFLCYLCFGVLSSHLKVNLPGIKGTMSVNYVFVLVGLIHLNPAQILLIGCASTAAQCVLHAKKRPKPVQLVFNSASSALSTFVCYVVFHAPLLRSINSSLPVLLFWSSSAYFCCNTLAIATVIALTEGKRVWRVWYDNFFWTAPQYLFGACIAWIVDVGTQQFGWEASVLVLPTIYLVDRSYRLYLGRLEQEKNHVDKMAALHLRTIKALALAIDAKDATTHDHLRRVQVYATEIGKEMGCSDVDLQALQAAALLHDIGKLAVPEYILSKPGRLTPEEFERMKVHPAVGAEILASVEFPYPVVPIVRHHHEKWNGMGYPDGLKGEEIPMGARILSAVDCLDALASDRQYRRALPLDEAMQVVISETGTSFDPRVIEILHHRYKELEQQAILAAGSEPKLQGALTQTAGDHAPAAGFEKTSGPAENPNDFLSSIAAARQEFQTLHEVSRDLGNSLSLDQTLSFLATRLKTVVPYDAIAINLIDKERLVPQYVSGQDTQLFASLEIPLGQGISGWVAQNKKPIVNGNPSVEPGYLNDPTKFSTLHSALSVPLESVRGVVGVLTLYRTRGDAFSKDDLRILLAISSKAGLTIDNALQYRQAQVCAVTDELTGLANTRSLFLRLDSELARAKRSGSRLGVLVLDLDGFKQVNDRFGHLQGNRVLQLVATGLRESCREYDYVARMGGDEFVVVLPNIPPDVARQRAHTLCGIVQAAGRQVTGDGTLSLSVGEAFFPEDGNDAEELLAKADKRMYQVKQEHRSGRAPEISVELLSLQTALTK